MTFQSKALPPIPDLRTTWWYRWYSFKDRVDSWLHANIYPPRIKKEERDFDTLIEDMDREEAEQRRLYPVRWFTKQTIEFIIRWPRLSNAWYWLRTHTYNRYHILDLRQAEPENLDGYRWGYLDECSRMELAMWLVLRDYIAHGNPLGGPLPDPLTWNEDLTDEEKVAIVPEEGDQLWQYRECMDLWIWWIKGRFDEEKERDSLYKVYSTNKEDELARKRWLDAEEAVEKKKVDQLVRLAKLSPYMWS